MKRIVVDVRPGTYSACRLSPNAVLPPELMRSADMVSVTRTADELSIICPEENVALLPTEARISAGWRLLTVRGPLEFTLTGIMAALSAALAAAGVTLFALSTFDTDHLLVRSSDLERAVRALRAGGHEVHSA